MPGSCASAPRSSNVSVKAPNPPSARNDRRPALDPGRRPQLGVAIAARSQRRRERVVGGVGVDQGVDLGLGDRRDALDEVGDAVAVDREAEPGLRLDLVAVGDRDLAHVVAEPRDPEPVRLVPARRRPRPPAEPRRDLRVLPVADDRLAAAPQPRLDERELPVAVGGLVEVHEVHVDLRPREIAVELRVEVDQRLAQVAEAGDPHLGRRERVHPGDDADAVGRAVGLAQDRGDAVRRRDDRLGDDRDRDLGRLVEARGDRPSVLADALQDRLAVQVLAARHEPRLELSQTGVHDVVSPIT